MSMHRPALLRAVPPALAALLVLAGFSCKRAAPPPQAPAPRYCPQDLSGVWVNASDTGYAYRLRDHGDAVEGVFFRRFPDGGAVPPEPTEEPMTLDLHRSPTALAGAMRTFDRTAQGRRCAVEFGISVSTCAAASLQVVSEVSAPIGEDCLRAREADGGEVKPDLAEYVWDRPAENAAPASADAGR